MAQVLNSLLPPGYTRVDGGPLFDVTRTGKAGRWDINQNDPFAVWEFTVSYIRTEFSPEQGEKFNEIYRFFLSVGAAFAFKVDDPIDNRDDTMGGEGHIELVNGVYRCTKHYPFGVGGYIHPITRLKPGVVLSGGAAGGVLDPNTGIVTGVNPNTPGRWAGGFYRPMVFMAGKLSYNSDPSGMIRSFDVPLQENLEV